MILQLTNLLLIPKVKALAKYVPNTNENVLEKMLLNGIDQKDSIIYINKRDEEVNGFIFATKETWEGEPVCFIQFCVIKPSTEEKYIGFEFLNKIRLWAKDKGLPKIITVIRRNPEGFKRKYKFMTDGILLKRSVL